LSSLFWAMRLDPLHTLTQVAIPFKERLHRYISPERTSKFNKYKF
jgi:hypothetical protein